MATIETCRRIYLRQLLKIAKCEYARQGIGVNATPGVLLHPREVITRTDPVLAANQAAQESVMIYTVSFSKEANQSQMKQFAAIGVGKHFHAATGEERANAFKEICQSFPRLVNN